MSVNRRFSVLINELYGGNKRAFANAVGVSPTVIENVVGARQGKPSYEVIDKMCANANIAPEWLLTGNGPMLRADEPPPTFQEPKDSRELEMCRALLKEKDARIEEQAKEIGRLEERLSTFQTRSRAQPSYGVDVPVRDPSDVSRDVPTVRDTTVPPRTHPELTEKRPPGK